MTVATAAAAARPRRARARESFREGLKEIRTAAIERSIIETAQVLFTRDGYAGTSMEAVAKAAGVSQGALYSRYPSTAMLFNAVVSYRLRVWFSSEQSPERLERRAIGEPLISRAIGILESLDEFETGAFHRLLTMQSDNFTQFAATFCKEDVSYAMALLTGRLGSLQRVTGRRSAEPDLVTMIFMYAVVGWFITGAAATLFSEDDRDAFVIKLANLLRSAREPIAK